ncbi:MAG: hypothetical protein PHF46_00700 [Candidatus Gracilibacteria bacterium]|nr:hypothetical protein [Candidatus Gracilibacteria bacterium]MDD3119914.1 hypothetical protein [Candidatus Gracilibacteria bacterium]MDD4530028.1 hypothetical protein [Candidatus Gracilibacteria bacterium]
MVANKDITTKEIKKTKQTNPYYDDFYEKKAKELEELKKKEREEGKKMLYLTKKKSENLEKGDTEDEDDFIIDIDDLDDDFDDGRLITFEEDDLNEEDIIKENEV